MRCDLDGSYALVTGAAGAIGSAICRRLHESGALVIIADINLPGAESLARSLPRSLPVAIDISREESVGEAAQQIESKFGRLDILVNNAGINSIVHRVPIDAYPIEEWHRIVGVDLDGMFLMSRAAVPLMRKANGRIVNIASVVGLAAMRLQSPFAAAKAAMIHLTRSMALELGQRNITVNAIAPGSVMTELTRKLFYSDDGSFAARTEDFMRHVPLGRPGTPEEIAEAVLYFASPHSGYVNGQVLAVDGGWSAGYMM